MEDALGRWDPWSPDQIFALLAGFEPPWWIAGGWALDLYLERQTRPHADTDIEIPATAMTALAGRLHGWDLRLASAGKLRRWDPLSAVPHGVNSLWCRPADGEPWRFQIMLATTLDDAWIYRRDDRIRRNLADVGMRSDNGVPHLAPEIQLLYKSKDVRPKDQQDFDTVIGRLRGAQQQWLRRALALVSPGHPWLDRLQD